MAQPAAQADPWAGITDPNAAPAAPAQVATPGSNDPCAGITDPNAEGAPTPPVQTQAPSLASDEKYNLGVAGVGLGKTAIGMLQLAASPHAPYQAPRLPASMPTSYTGNDPVLREQAARNRERAQTIFETPDPSKDQALTDPILTAQAAALPAKLQTAQGMLSGIQQNLTSKESPGFQAAANAPLNPMTPGNVFTHPLVQAALAKGTGPVVDLLATLIPAGFAGLIVRGAGGATLAATAGGMGAGGTMSAVADTVNNTPDSQLKNLVPAYAALRQKGMSIPAAKADLTSKLGDTQALWQGALDAALADVGGASVVGALGKDIGKAGLAARVGAEAGVLGGVGAGTGAASSLAQQQAVAPLPQAGQALLGRRRQHHLVAGGLQDALLQHAGGQRVVHHHDGLGHELDSSLRFVACVPEGQRPRRMDCSQVDRPGSAGQAWTCAPAASSTCSGAGCR